MKSLFLSKSDRDIIVFHLWKSLKYEIRIFLSLVFILGGFILQVLYFELFPGILLVLTGILFLLTKGYNNKVDFGKFKADTEWEKADQSKLNEIVELQRKMKKWDKDPIDITNGIGCLVLFIVCVALILVLYIFTTSYNLFYSMNIYLVNTLVIVLPFWITGVRKITKMPALVNKINLFHTLITTFTEKLQSHQVENYILLGGKDKNIPYDVKIKINIKDQPDNFLGVYGQVSINTVSGTDYPYFYTVIVTYKTFGLKKHFDKVELPPNIIKEFKEQNDVEIIVIRQHTTKTSGYFTKPAVINAIFNAAMFNAVYIIKQG
ncbi:MAG: hypothetical protein ABIJ97_13485 [Bacteroidota bacterium]